MISILTFSKWLKIIGVLSLILGIINFFGSDPEGIRATNLSDALINVSFGLVAFWAAFLLDKRNQLVFIPVGFYFIISIAYGLWAGRGFNFISLMIAPVVLFWLWQFKNKGEIS